MGGMTERQVETMNLTKRQGPRTVVDHVGLWLRSGEVSVFSAAVLDQAAYLAMFAAASTVPTSRRNVA